jgi:hypothetical protein
MLLLRFLSASLLLRLRSSKRSPLISVSTVLVLLRLLRPIATRLILS